MDYADRNWTLVDTRTAPGGATVALFYDGQGTWAVCDEGIQPWHAEAALTGCKDLAYRWFEKD